MDTGFILFSPDCTTTGLYLEALSWLSERGVVFHEFAWKKLGPTDVANLYADNRSARSYSQLDELVERLFTIDYSLAIRVRTPAASDVHEYLTKLKGPSDPAMASPWHLRRWLGATNKVLNFVHMSDTAAAAGLESRLFFVDRGEFQPSVQPSPVPPEPPSLRRIPSVSGFLLRCKLKRRVTAQPAAAVSDRFQKNVQAEWELLTSARDHLALVPSLKELLHAQLRELEASPDRGLVNIEVARYMCYDSLDPSTACSSYDSLVSLLQEAGVHTSSWEDLILACETWSRRERRLFERSYG